MQAVNFCLNAVLNWEYYLTQVVPYNGCNMVVVVIAVYIITVYVLLIIYVLVTDFVPVIGHNCALLTFMKYMMESSRHVQFREVVH